MKGQWGLIVGLIIVLVISVFAVINVDPVTVNYGFGQADWPLVLVIIGSVLMGGLMIGSVGMVKIMRLQQEIKQLKAGNGSDETKTRTNKKGKIFRNPTSPPLNK